MTEPTQLHALADGELAPQEVQTLREALKADSKAAAELNAILNLKDLLAKNAVAHADPEVWKGCVRRLDAIDKTRRVEGFLGRYAWALCGALFLFILSGRVAMRNVQGDSARISDILPFARSGRHATAQSRMESNAYRAILNAVSRNLDPKEIQVFEPVYGRVHDFPAVRVPLRDREGDLVLTDVGGSLDLQDTAPFPTDATLATGIVDGQNCVVWKTEGETWVLNPVNGPRSLESLREVATRIRGAR